MSIHLPSSTKHQPLPVNEAKHRVKLYKVGKFWLSAGMTLITLGSVGVLTQISASAESTSTDTPTAVTQTVATNTGTSSVTTLSQSSDTVVDIGTDISTDTSTVQSTDTTNEPATTSTGIQSTDQVPADQSTTAEPQADPAVTQTPSTDDQPATNVGSDGTTTEPSTTETSTSTAADGSTKTPNTSPKADTNVMAGTHILDAGPQVKTQVSDVSVPATTTETEDSTEQKAIIYFDDSDAEESTVGTQTLTGPSGTKIPTDTLNIPDGYELKDPDTPLDLGTYDTDDSTDQMHAVELVHQIIEGSPVVVDRSIVYWYAKEVKTTTDHLPEVVEQQIVYVTQTDAVTGATTYAPMYGIDIVPEVDSPVLEGLTPDITVVPKLTITTATADKPSNETIYVLYSPISVTSPITLTSNLDDQVIDNVTGNTGDTIQVTVPAVQGYTPDKANVNVRINSDSTMTIMDPADADGNIINYTVDPENMTIFYDDVLNDWTPIGMQTLTGPGGTTIPTDNLTIPDDYELVDPHNPINFGVYDLDSSMEQTTVVGVTHKQTVNAPVTVTRSIVYQLAAGSNLVSGTMLPDTVQQMITYTSMTDGATNETLYDPLGSNAAVPTPKLTGYTADIDTVPAQYPMMTDELPTDSSILVTYTSDPVTADITVPSNRGAQTFKAVTGKVGDTVTLPVPKQLGYTATKTAIDATFNTDGSLTTTDMIDYEPNQVTATVTIPSNLGDQKINYVTGKTGDTIKVPVPVIQGYTPNQDTIDAIANPDGSITTDATVKYELSQVTATVTIPSNFGDQSVDNVTGKTGDTVQVTVPTVQGYTPDQGTVDATVNLDGTITTTDSVTYTADPVQPEDTTASTDMSTSKTSTNSDPATNTVTNAPSTANAGSNNAQASAPGSGLPVAQAKTPTDPSKSIQANESEKPGTSTMTSTKPSGRSGEIKTAGTMDEHPETGIETAALHQGVTNPTTTKTAVTTAIAPSVKNESAAGQRPSAGTADVTKTALPQTSDTTADSLVAIGVSLLVMLAGLLGFETRDPSKH